MQKSPFILLSVLCVVLPRCSSFILSGPAVAGSGNIVSENRPVSQFDRVSVSGSGQLSIVQGDQESLTVETDDNLVPLIKSEVDGGSLTIGSKNVNLKPTKPIHYTLRLKNLKELHLSGSLEAEAQSLRTGQLLVALSGSGSVSVEKLEAGDLDAQISGSGGIELAGKAGRQEIGISGSGKYRAGNCESQKTAVHISGSGSATVRATSSLDAEVSGSGDVTYYGSPHVNSHVSGSGRIHSMGD
jgi:hypothetical protein